ncbi:nanos homolog 2 [Diaphorina citri]|uniref:Nanos homolog 2 n=1 Tax=Diaphorina citri TaxID=121845 RepID=A0A3Q0JDI4_DIACI|nr:nanos homolog 2 [Diaphorina citri]KAI5703883.1 hypothetical protein M8J76_016264 [Diaphorina citri]KAI5755219.1 hypothetical protein M8J77_015126 [Diaphorina citri]
MAYSSTPSSTSPGSSFNSPRSLYMNYSNNINGNGRKGIPGCTFCFQNKEIKAIYLSHSVKNGVGQVTCPVLYNNVCPYCQATGPQAHTKNYCLQNPNKESFKTYLKYRNASGGNYGNRALGYRK